MKVKYKGKIYTEFDIKELIEDIGSNYLYTFTIDIVSFGGDNVKLEDVEMEDIVNCIGDDKFDEIIEEDD